MKPDPKATILVVDDLEDNLQLVREILEDDPYEVLTAMNAKDALETINQEVVDLAIIDVHMPEIDGFELCRKIREEHSSDLMPIIFLTSHCTNTESVVRGLDIGACDYLSKPVNADEMRARLRAILRSEDEHAEKSKRAERVAVRLLKS